MMVSPAVSLPDTQQLLTDFITQAKQLVTDEQRGATVVVGIHTGGVWLAQMLAESLDLPLGKLDISFYRDDFTRQGLNPKVSPSSLPFGINDRHVILVDDVLMSGRTVRAALNELFDYGRPASIQLATLCAIQGRELPIQPDVCALHIALASHQYLQLDGPAPLQLNLIERL